MLQIREGAEVRRHRSRALSAPDCVTVSNVRLDGAAAGCRVQRSQHHAGPARRVARQLHLRCVGHRYVFDYDQQGRVLHDHPVGHHDRFGDADQRGRLHVRCVLHRDGLQPRQQAPRDDAGASVTAIVSVISITTGPTTVTVTVAELLAGLASVSLPDTVIDKRQRTGSRGLTVIESATVSPLCERAKLTVDRAGAARRWSAAGPLRTAAADEGDIRGKRQADFDVGRFGRASVRNDHRRRSDRHWYWPDPATRSRRWRGRRDCPTMTVTVSLAVPPWPSLTVNVIVCVPSGSVGETMAPLRVPKGPLQLNVSRIAVRIVRGRSVERHDRADRVQQRHRLIGAGVRNRRLVGAGPGEDPNRGRRRA